MVRIESADYDTVTVNHVGDGTGGGQQIILQSGHCFGNVLERRAANILYYGEHIRSQRRVGTE